LAAVILAWTADASHPLETANELNSLVKRILREIDLYIIVSIIEVTTFLQHKNNMIKYQGLPSCN